MNKVSLLNRIIECLDTSLTSTHYMPSTHPPPKMYPDIVKYSLGERERNYLQLRNIGETLTAITEIPNHANV